MPIYEFQCDACGYCFEKLQKINDSVPECPKCKDIQVRKLVSAPSFQLKGSGWYKSDYKNTKPDDNKSSSKTESSDNKKENKSSTEKSTKDSTENKTQTKNNSGVKEAA